MARRPAALSRMSMIDDRRVNRERPLSSEGPAIPLGFLLRTRGGGQPAVAALSILPFNGSEERSGDGDCEG